MIDFSRINLIKNSKIDDLLDESYLIKLLDQIGLVKSDSGLYVYQDPVEFAKYLITLSKHFPICSYLEIGTAWGGSFIVTVEYLRKLNKNFRVAIACDIKKYRFSLNIYSKVNKYILYYIIDSQTPAFKQIAKHKFDLVFIDGDHSYNAVKNDFYSVKDVSLIGFHDILDPNAGVKYFWDEIKHSKRNYFEFDQSGNMGIGLLTD